MTVERMSLQAHDLFAFVVVTHSLFLFAHTSVLLPSFRPEAADV